MLERRDDVLGEIDESKFTHRELLAISLAERISRDPHSIDETFFAELQDEFTDEEIIDLCFAVWLFSGGNAFNIALDLVPENCQIEV